MKKELVKSAAEMLKQATELAASAAEMMEQGKDAPAEMLAEARRLSSSAQTMLNEESLPKKEQARLWSVVLRKAMGATICVGMTLYFVPELRQDVMSTVEWLSREWRRGK